MPVIVSIKSATSNTFFTCNGKRRAGAWRFQRNPQKTEFHEIRFATAAEFNAVAEDILCAQGNPPMVVTVLPEEAPADTALKEQLANLTAEKDALSVSMSQLEQRCAKAETALAEKQNGTGPSEQERKILAEYDSILDLLRPHALESEDPIDVVRRLLAGSLSATEEPTEAEPPKEREQAPENVDPLNLPYEEMLRYAKSELGLTFEKKPAKAALEQAVKEKLGRV